MAPIIRNTAITRFAAMSPNVSSISAYNIVKRMPKTCAPAFRRPELVPSGSGYVSSAANSKPTGR